jgi:hypothetical protein
LYEKSKQTDLGSCGLLALSLLITTLGVGYGAIQQSSSSLTESAYQKLNSFTYNSHNVLNRYYQNLAKQIVLIATDNATIQNA